MERLRFRSTRVDQLRAELEPAREDARLAPRLDVPAERRPAPMPLLRLIVRRLEG